jgi:tetratricopeptide (TPR) repeat protein
LIQDALDASLRAGPSPAARMQAARAAYLLGETADALRYATEGMDAAHGAEIDVDRQPQRTLAEAAYAAYVAARDAGAEPAEVRDLYARTEGALTSLLGRAPSDPWVHAAIAGLYEWDGKVAEARDALMRGIDRMPSAEARAGMVGRLAELARRATDRTALETFEELARRHPQLAEAHRELGKERFWRALEQLEAGAFHADAFRAAEASFRRARELRPELPELDGEMRGWEAICRNGAGWCLYRTGAIEAAEAAFRSMAESLEHGLEWRFEDRLPDGLTGLAFCAQAYLQAGDLLGAAEINDHLRHVKPDDVTYANDAGLLLRDAAYQIERFGRNLCYAAQGLVENAEAVAAWRARAGIDAAVAPGSPEERDALRAAANRAIDDARALMQRSADAYRAAAELAPDDVRIVNDTALILVYYLHTDIDAAKAMLQRCVELGAEQIADPALDEESRFALRSAWGDAHQNLGVLAYEYEDDDAAALAWFEKSMEIDPEGRADVRDFWLPFLRGEIEAAEDEDYLAIRSWAAPCE